MTVKQRVSPALIGAFVIGAVVLAVAAVVLIGSGRLFHRTTPFVLYFPGSVNGLRIGAPVKFHGVEIGAVENIRLQLQPDQTVTRIPVIVGIDPEKITSLGGSETILNSPEAFQTAIDSGFRGQLQTESFVTGVLYVALDYFPGHPVTLVQLPRSKKFRYRELPTEPSPAEQMRNSVNEVLGQLAQSDLKGLVDSVRLTISDLHGLIASPELKLTLRSLGNVVGRLGDAAGSVSQLATGLDTNVAGLVADLRHTGVEARATMGEAGKVLEHTDAAFTNSAVLDELTRTLQEVSAAARSVRLLTGYLERNPTSIMFGRPVAQEK